MDILAHGASVAQLEESGTVVSIKDADGAPLLTDDGTSPVTITVKGSYSPTYRRVSEANRDRLLKRRSTQMDGDELDQRSLELTAACVSAWSGFTAGNAEYPLTKPNAIALLKACPWIREQVEAAMHDHALFFAKS